MTKPNEPPKPLSSNQSKQSSSKIEEAQVDVNGWLVVEEKKPRRYTFKIALFNGPNKELADLRLFGPLGEVTVTYTPDSGQPKVRDPIKLCLDKGRISTVFFKDGFNDIIWNDVLDITVHFDKGTITFKSETGVRTNAVMEWTLKIENKPEEVLGMTYDHSTSRDAK